MFRLFPNIRLAPETVSVNGSGSANITLPEVDDDGPGELGEPVNKATESVDGQSKNAKTAKTKAPAAAANDDQGDTEQDEDTGDTADESEGESTDGSGKRGHTAAEAADVDADEKADLVVLLGKDRVEKLLKHGPAGVELAREEAAAFEAELKSGREKRQAKAAADTAKDDALEPPLVLKGQETTEDDAEEADELEADDKPADNGKPAAKLPKAVVKATEAIFKDIPAAAVEDYDLANGEGSFKKTFGPIVTRIAEAQTQTREMLARVEKLADDMGGMQIETFLDMLGDDELGKSRFDLEPPHVTMRREVVNEAFEVMQHAKATKRQMSMSQALKIGWRTVKRERAEKAAKAQRQQHIERRARSVAVIPPRSDGGGTVTSSRSNAAAAAAIDKFFAKR